MNGVDYVFGLPGTMPLSRKVDEAAVAIRTERALNVKDVVREPFQRRAIWQASSSRHCVCD
jgi:hypothetical protein